MLVLALLLTVPTWGGLWCPTINTLTEEISQQALSKRITDWAEQYFAKNGHWQAPGMTSHSRFLSLASFPELVEEELIFVDLENAYLKTLNDKIFKDKMVSQTVEEIWRTIIDRNFRAQGLEPVILGQYSDYKSVRLALRKSTPELETKLAAAFEASTQEFAGLIANSPLEQHLLDAGLMTTNVLSPDRWHVLGIGNSLNESDMAARMARESGPAPVVAFENIAQAMQESWATMVKHIKKMKLLADSSLPKALWSAGHPGVPSEMVFEILRKSSDMPTQEALLFIQTRLETRVKTSLPMEVCQELLEYFMAINKFSPGLVETELQTTFKIGSSSEKGVFSIDFAGQGARNLELLSLALDELPENASNARVLKTARESLERSAQLLRERQIFLMSQLNNQVPAAQVIESFLSGDDGIVLLADPMSVSTAETVLKNIAHGPYPPGQFRLNFVSAVDELGHAISSEKLSTFVGQVETNEKKLRVILETKLPFDLAQKVMISFDFHPLSSGGGQIKMIITGDAVTGPILKSLESYLKAIINSDVVILPSQIISSVSRTRNFLICWSSSQTFWASALGMPQVGEIKMFSPAWI